MGWQRKNGPKRCAFPWLAWKSGGVEEGKRGDGVATKRREGMGGEKSVGENEPLAREGKGLRAVYIDEDLCSRRTGATATATSTAMRRTRRTRRRKTRPDVVELDGRERGDDRLTAGDGRELGFEGWLLVRGRGGACLQS